MSPNLLHEVSEVPRLKMVLGARGLAFSYGATAVLHDVHLELNAGTSTAIMGPSGSGKSTLLQILAGMLTPTSGTVEVEGQDFSTLREARRNSLRLKEFGFVFQFGELLPELTLVENVELPLLFLGVSRREATKRALEALADVGLSEQARRFLHQVSGGQQQRAAIARAIVHRPSVILADEPTGSLDETSADQVLNLVLASASDYKAAVVLVTHSREVAQRCDRALTLETGTLRRLEER
jgi:putative ABC transport system ATP-binding protein